MSFIKIGENFNFTIDNILEAKEALAEPEIAQRFVKLAKQLKRIAPKAEDFLYGHAIMMTAAERSLLNDDGNPKLNAKGEPVKGWFEAVKLKNGKESIKWISPDGIKPYKNHNGDIFSEAELKKAYKMWIGKPLCKDHKSDSVEGIRGIIVDTYYDNKKKHVHALFALDRKNYGDLARKVETGYANSVSMGTAVGRSVCTECSNIATVEKEYCNCIRARANYGEINLDLNPIELSLVVNGADGLAKIRHIIASMNNYVNSKHANIEKMKSDRCINPTELQALADSVNEIQIKLKTLMPLEKMAEDDKGDTARLIQALQEQIDKSTDTDEKEQLEAKKKAVLNGLPEEDSAPEASRATVGGGEGYAMQAPETEPTNISLDPSKRLASIEGDHNQGALVNEIGLLRSKLENMNKDINDLRLSISKEEKNMNSARLRARAKARRAYWLGGGGVNEPTPGKPKYDKEDADKIRDKEDKQMTGEPLETGSEGMHPGDEEVKKKLLRAQELQDRKLKREALVKEVKGSDSELTEVELEARRLNRRAYFQGGGGINEPTPGKPKYPKEDADSIRNNEDKHMVGEGLETGRDGLMGDDLKVKEQLLRAKLRARLTKVADNKGASKWDIFAGDKLILSATASEAFEDEVDANWDFFSSKDYGKEVIKSIRSEGFDRTVWLLKGAAEPVAPVAPEAALPAPAPEMGAPAPAAPVAEEASVAEEKKDSEMLNKVNAALSTMEEKISEIRDLVSGGGNELVDVDMNANKEAAPMDKVLASNEDMLKVESLLDDAADELALVSETLEGLNKLEASAKVKLLKAASEALSDSDDLVSEANLVIEAAKKKKDKKKDKKEDKKDKEDSKKDKKEDKEEKDDKKDEKEAKAQELLDRALKVRASNRAALLKAAMDPEMMALTPQEEGKMKQLLEEEKKEVDSAGKPMHPQLAKDKGDDEDDDEDEDEKEDEDFEVEEDEDEKDEDDAGDGLALPMMAEEGDAMCAHGPEEMHDANCMPAMDNGPFPASKTASARRAERDKLVSEASDILGKYELDLGKAENATEPTYFKAHPGGKGTVTELTHSKTPEAKVETISEIHNVMREVAESGPRNVREAAAVIQEQIVKGAFTSEDLDRLVAEGKVDSAAASYWKKYFGQAAGAGSFGSDLSKEFSSKKKEASDTGYRVKLRRAYDVGLQAQEKGLIATTRDALDTYVDEIMHFDDAAFESNKRVIANYKASKKSGALPRVGVDAAGQAMSVTASAEPTPEPDLNDMLGSLGWK